MIKNPEYVVCETVNFHNLIFHNILFLPVKKNG